MKEKAYLEALPIHRLLGSVKLVPAKVLGVLAWCLSMFAAIQQGLPFEVEAWKLAAIVTGIAALVLFFQLKFVLDCIGGYMDAIGMSKGLQIVMVVDEEAGTKRQYLVAIDGCVEVQEGYLFGIPPDNLDVVTVSTGGSGRHRFQLDHGSESCEVEFGYLRPDNPKEIAELLAKYYSLQNGCSVGGELSYPKLLEMILVHHVSEACNDQNLYTCPTFGSLIAEVSKVIRDSRDRCLYACFEVEPLPV